MVVSYKVNLDISTVDALGTEEDPVGYDQFESMISELAVDDTTYEVKGYYLYTDDIVIPHSDKEVIITAWGDGNPALSLNGKIKKL